LRGGKWLYFLMKVTAVLLVAWLQVSPPLPDRFNYEPDNMLLTARQISLLRLFIFANRELRMTGNHLCPFLLIHTQLGRSTGLWSKKKQVNIGEERQEVRMLSFWIKSCELLSKNQARQSLHCNNASTNTHHFAISWTYQYSLLLLKQNTVTMYVMNLGSHLLPQ
jgi:hypothetical protein